MATMFSRGDSINCATLATTDHKLIAFLNYQGRILV
jgi:hypothetical protein